MPIPSKKAALDFMRKKVAADIAARAEQLARVGRVQDALFGVLVARALGGSDSTEPAAATPAAPAPASTAPASIDNVIDVEYTVLPADSDAKANPVPGVPRKR